MRKQVNIAVVVIDLIVGWVLREPLTFCLSGKTIDFLSI